MTLRVCEYLNFFFFTLSLIITRTQANTATRVIKALEVLNEAYHYNVECKIKGDIGEKEPCLPQICSRHVLDGVFVDDDIKALHTIAKKGMSSRGMSQGGPTILDINTGFIRDSKGLENLFTRDASSKIFTDEDFGVYGKIITKLKETVTSTMGATELYFTAPTFITRLDGSAEWNPSEIHDEYWHPHADRNNTPHYHYSGLLYMSTKDDDFTGGDLVLYDADSGQDRPKSQDDIDKAMVGIKFFDEEQLRIEPRAGRVVIFSSGHENPHKVERVLSGQRFVLAFWFTCDKRRAFQVFLDGAAHSAFSEEFADDLKKKAGHSEVPTQRPETAAAKKRRRRKSNSGGPRAENDAEL